MSSRWTTWDVVRGPSSLWGPCLGTRVAHLWLEAVKVGDQHQRTYKWAGPAHLLPSLPRSCFQVVDTFLTNYMLSGDQKTPKSMFNEGISPLSFTVSRSSQSSSGAREGSPQFSRTPQGRACLGLATYRRCAVASLSQGRTISRKGRVCSDRDHRVASKSNCQICMTVAVQSFSCNGPAASARWHAREYMHAASSHLHRFLHSELSWHWELWKYGTNGVTYSFLVCVVSTQGPVNAYDKFNHFCRGRARQEPQGAQLTKKCWILFQKHHPQHEAS